MNNTKFLIAATSELVANLSVYSAVKIISRKERKVGAKDAKGKTKL